MDNNHHDNNCDCGCNHEHDFPQVNLVLDDGSELNCIVLEVFEIEDNSYIALLPEDEDEVLLYKYIENDNEDDFQLENIESDEEFEIVKSALYELFEEEEDE